jgi:hypothetical protein
MFEKPDFLQGRLIILGKETQLLNWAGLGYISVKITLFSIRNHPNYGEIFKIHM